MDGFQFPNTKGTKGTTKGMAELFLNCFLNFRFFEEQLDDGRMEVWKDGIWEPKTSVLFSVHDGDPPFAGKDDADASTVSEQMFGFRGSLYKFPPRIRNPQFGDFVCSFVS